MVTATAPKVEIRSAIQKKDQRNVLHIGMIFDSTPVLLNFPFESSRGIVRSSVLHQCQSVDTVALWGRICDVS